VQVPCLNGSDQLQTPTALLEALARRHDLRDVTPYHLHTAGPAAFAAPEQRGRFRSVSFFAGAPVRDAHRPRGAQAWCRRGDARSQETVLGIARMTANGYALLVVALSVGLQLAAMYVHPLPELLRIVPLDPGQWAVVLVASLAPALAGQAVKALRAGESSRD
jgi:hypothetical protein